MNDKIDNVSDKPDKKNDSKIHKKKSLKGKIMLLVLLLIVLFALMTVLEQSSPDSGILSCDNIEGTNLSVTVTGDVMFGRKMPQVLSADESPYRYVGNVTGSSDILLVNTENPFTTSSSPVKPDVPLKANPDYIDLANGTNYTVVSANANNHVFDYGIDGLRDSLTNLDNAGIRHIGAGENKSQATEPAVIEKNGYTVTIFNFMDSDNFQEYSNEVMPAATDTSAGYSAWDDVQSPQMIQQAKNNGSDFVIVYMHYGNEYSRSPNGAQRNISHMAIDAGADTVVGSHPHVTQGIEMYKDKPIFYSLGNFMFDQSNPATHRAYFVNFQLEEENVTATVYPVDIINYLPHFMDSGDGKALLEELNPQCPDLTVTDSGTGKLSFKLGNSTSGK